jgi:hypothetical protein
MKASLIIFYLFLGLATQAQAQTKAMREELSAEMAKKFLDAHESNEPDSDPGKAMDLANNRAGLLAAESLLKAGKLNQEEIEKAALNELRNKTLIVLKPKGGPQ